MYTNTGPYGQESSDMPQLIFGYSKALDDEPGFAAAFGARAIHDGEHLDLLHDRQAWTYRDERAKNALATILNKCGVLRISFNRFRELVCNGTIRSDLANEVVLYNDGSVRVVGNTNGSHGYFYMTAILSTKAFDPPEKTSVDKSGPGIITWSGHRLPLVGERVRARMNSVGPGTVVGYQYETDGHETYLYLMVYPDRQPAWWNPENEDRRGIPSYFWIMGREWDEDIDL
jgi:hypothetical protein